MSHSLKVKILVGQAFVAAVLFFFLIAPIPQPQSYHELADQIPRMTIPNFANVISNLAYLIPALLGLNWLRANFFNREKFIDGREIIPFTVLFLGTLLVAFSSSFYHLEPNNLTLVADRLTITIGFMGVFSFMIVERISLDWGLKLLPYLLVVGLFSVLYWIFTEIAAVGDLRIYALVQIVPFVLFPIILLMFPARYTGVKYIIWTLVLYLVAKIFETYDREIWQVLGETLSGHTLKHITSGIGVYFLLLYIQKRKPL